MSTRRRFLQQAPALLALSGLAPGALLRAAEESQASADGRILVVVQLTGGNDGLNTVVPFADPVYRQSRPTLAVPPDQALRINAELGWHPALRGFADLLEGGQLAVVQGVGYPRPNHSHFESMDIWQTCRRKEERRIDGWLGRCVERFPAGASPGLPALHLGPEQQPLALASRRLRIPSLRSAEQLRLERDSEQASSGIAAMAAVQRSGADDLLGFVQSSTTTALDVAQRFNDDDALEPLAGFPATELGRKLGQAARLIASGLETRIYYVALDGFDTHAEQAAAHAGLLRQLGDAVAALLRGLRACGQGERVLVMAFSEFGRRVAENASAGTDHGAAAPMFLAGERVRAGLIGPPPDLTDLESGDLRHHTDFRQVYACVLERWLGCPGEEILGGAYTAVDAIAAST